MEALLTRVRERGGGGGGGGGGGAMLPPCRPPRHCAGLAQPPSPWIPPSRPPTSALPGSPPSALPGPPDRRRLPPLWQEDGRGGMIPQRRVVGEVAGIRGRDPSNRGWNTTQRLVVSGMVAATPPLPQRKLGRVGKRGEVVGIRGRAPSQDGAKTQRLAASSTAATTPLL